MDFLKKISGYLKTRTAVIAVAILLLGGLGYYYKNLLVVATVNGSPISRWSVLSQLEASSGKSVLDSIITKKLIEDEASSKNVSVSAEDIDGEIKIIEERLKEAGYLYAHIELKSPIKTLGEYEIPVLFVKNLKTTAKIVVKGE